MTQLTITGGSIVLPDSIEQNWELRSEKNTIAYVGPRARETEVQNGGPADLLQIDASNKYVVPGFVDLHVHGGAGADFMDGTPEAVEQACRCHLQHGTTTIFPTTTTGDSQQIHLMLDACKQVRGREEMPNIPGIHLYGPYFSPDKVGCHSLAGCRPPVSDEYQAYFETGFVRIATCAAELEGASGFYRAARDSGCFITCGHSNSSWPEMQSAFDLGMRHVDHFWCAMSSVPSLRNRFGTPMQASMAEFVIMNNEMSTEVIADGFHLAPELLEFAYRMLGPERLCLVTDCNRALGLPPGRYRFGNEQDGSWFRSDGEVGWADDGKSLASSIRGMDHMLRTMYRNSTASLQDVVRMASLTPAERAGVASQTGSLEVGKAADILILNQELDVEQVILRGERVVDHSATA